MSNDSLQRNTYKFLYSPYEAKIITITLWVKRHFSVGLTVSTTLFHLTHNVFSIQAHESDTCNRYFIAMYVSRLL